MFDQKLGGQKGGVTYNPTTTAINPGTKKFKLIIKLNRRSPMALINEMSKGNDVRVALMFYSIEIKRLL